MDASKRINRKNRTGEQWKSSGKSGRNCKTRGAYAI